jgi:hypothetical protein
MSLWEYANPKKFIETSDRVLPWVTGLAVICLVVGLVWGFFFTPDDFRQGSTVKIIYLHVPSAMMAINTWFDDAGGLADLADPPPPCERAGRARPPRRWASPSR